VHFKIPKATNNPNIINTINKVEYINLTEYEKDRETEIIQTFLIQN